MTVKALEDVLAETSFGYIALHGTGWYSGGHLLAFEHGRVNVGMWLVCAFALQRNDVWENPGEVVAVRATGQLPTRVAVATRLRVVNVVRLLIGVVTNM